MTAAPIRAVADSLKREVEEVLRAKQRSAQRA